MKPLLILITLTFLAGIAAAQDAAPNVSEKAVDNSTTKADVSGVQSAVLPDPTKARTGGESEESPIGLPRAPAVPGTKDVSDTRPQAEPDDAQDSPDSSDFAWGPALRQSALFLGIQHGYALTQPKTRSALRGPFFRDYFRSVKSLKGWADGGRFFTNYIAHPLQGSLAGFVQIQNDPKGRKLEFANTKQYWRSRLKAAAWSAAVSTQFEIGPLSQASIGNVGHYGKQTWVDIVVTPTVGTALLITEDFLDRYVIKKLERRFPTKLWLKVIARVFLNPTRTSANMLAFKEPWRRYTPR